MDPGHLMLNSDYLRQFGISVFHLTDIDKSVSVCRKDYRVVVII